MNNTHNIASTQKSFFSMLSNGDLGLAKTFRLYGLLVGFVTSILLTPLASIQLLVITILVVATLYAIPLNIGVWKAANKYEGRKVWATLAKIHVKVNIFIVMFSVLVAILLVGVDRYLSNV